MRRVDHAVVEAKAETRVELSELAEKAAAVGFAGLAEILETWRPTKGEDIERMAAITAQRPSRFCDNCISESLELRRTQNAQKFTNTLATTDGFQRGLGFC